MQLTQILSDREITENKTVYSARIVGRGQGQAGEDARKRISKAGRKATHCVKPCPPSKGV